MDPSNLLLANRATVALKYKKLSVNMKKTCLKIWFNSTCLRNHLIPNFIQLHSRNTSTRAAQAMDSGRLHWLKEEIKHWYTIRDHLNFQLYDTHLFLSKLFHHLELDSIISTVKEKVEAIGVELFEKLNKKLKALFSKKGSQSQRFSSNNTNGSNFTFHNRVVNLSNIRFSESELVMIRQGLKHNPRSLDQPLLNQFKLDLEVILQKNQDNPKFHNI
ncbi:hypothetical protein RI129_003122 [Pyrocoelia pectoralis]|uniref:Uncharacterized protein n=1 Tax=Pyrocoelia pectoralis TaxID=417401 RepID=A0AAN7ZIE7_9COLE